MSKSAEKGDPVVSKLLDLLLDVTGIDPTSLFPEHRLKKDLELSNSQIEGLFKRLEREFAKKLSFVPNRDYTLREITHFLGRKSA